MQLWAVYFSNFQALMKWGGLKMKYTSTSRYDKDKTPAYKALEVLLIVIFITHSIDPLLLE